MAKLYIDEEDPLATTTYNATDVLMDFGEVLTAEALTAAADEAGHETAVQHAVVEAQQPLVEVGQQNAAGTSQVANVLEGLQQILERARSGEEAPQARVPYGTLAVTPARQKARDEQAAVCCLDRPGGPGPAEKKSTFRNG